MKSSGIYINLAMLICLSSVLAVSCKHYRTDASPRVHYITGMLHSSLTNASDTGFKYSSEEFYQNGQLKSRAYFSRNGDTTYSWIYDKKGRLIIQNIPYTRIRFEYNSDTATWYTEGSLTEETIGKSQCYCMHIPKDSSYWKFPVADIIQHICSDGAVTDTLYFLYDSHKRPLGFLQQSHLSGNSNFLAVRYDSNNNPVLISSSGEEPAVHFTYRYNEKKQLKEAYLLPARNGIQDTSVVVKYYYDYY